MKLVSLLSLGLALVALPAAAQTRPKPYVPKTPPPAAAKPANPEAGGRTPEFINGVRDVGQFLPDSAVIARVDTRVIRAVDFVDAYFAQYPEYRPAPDSTGRLAFLKSLIHKNVLGLAALSSGREFGFEDRLALRTHTQRTLSNAVYQHYVIDSVRVEEPEIRAFYETQKYTQHFRQILFADRATAAKVRDQITARKLTWDAAFARYDIGGGNSDLGWVEQSALSPDVALLAYPLAAGAISQPIPDRQHWRLFQSVERRPKSDAPEYHAVRTMLRMTILSLRTSERAEAIQAILRARIGMAYDTTAVQWVSTYFGSKSNLSMNMGHQGSPEMSVVDTVPAFAPEDTSRVLATWKDGGRLTLSTVLHAYTDITPVSRPPMSTPEAVQAQIDALVLEPYMAQYAVEKGLDQDPFVQRMIAQKREELLVKHMYGDSVESRVWVSKADRQKYYKDHPADFTTYPSVTFAAFTATSKPGADSLAARLRGGESARSILLADSLAGIHRGSIQVRTEAEHGAYHKLLFEELRPGQVSIEGPDRDGDYVILQSLAFDPGHLLPYEQVEGLVDESLQNIRAEQMLNAMIDRLSKRYKIESHPELVMRIKLVDPTLDSQ